MGEEGIANGERNIKLKVFSASKITKVDIIKNNEIIHTVSSSAASADTEILFKDNKDSGKPVDYYYARITENENELTWTSPIWVKK